MIPAIGRGCCPFNSNGTPENLTDYELQSTNYPPENQSPL
jgi:hypothetical protein